MAKTPHNSSPAIKVGEVQDDIPIPLSALDRGTRYPLAKLTKPGMSFFISGGRPSTITSAIYDAARKLGIKVRCLTFMEKDGAGKDVPGIRVWRMPDEWARGSGRPRTKDAASAAREPGKP